MLLDNYPHSDLTHRIREFSSKELRTVGNYALGRLIGKGSFGKVYLATHRLTNGSKVRPVKFFTAPGSLAYDRPGCAQVRQER